MNAPINVPFDVPTWTQHLNTADTLALVIRGHLYVDAALIRKIETALVDKSKFKTERLPFMMKVGFAVA